MLREFLKNMGNLCTEDKVLGARIGLSAVLDFDHELKDSCSAFSMKKVDFVDPKKRMQHLFAWKYLPDVDTRKAERCELLVNLLAMNHYRNKYQTEQYDEDIKTMEATVKSEPIPEVDSQLTMDVTTKGYWSD